MEFITANLGSQVKRRTHDGREYLVAPVTMLRPRVLNGSKGKLFYPADEIARNHQDWDEKPLTIDHPMAADGSHISASDPGVFEKQGVGFIRSSRIRNGGPLVAEAWFDVEKTRQLDRALPETVRILPRLFQGQKLEVSTGLFTENEPVQGHINGQDYDYIARRYVPDHLAVLPSSKGACAIEDGCGVLVNQNRPRKPRIDNAEDDCAWRTIHGSPVCIKGGEIVKGPKDLEGKKPSEISDKKEKPKAARQAKSQADPKDLESKKSGKASDKGFKERIDKLVAEAHQGVGCEVGGGKGKCGEIAVDLWDRMGKPKDLTPFGVSLTKETDTPGDDHIVLLDEKTGMVVDPTAYQYGKEQYTSKEATGFSDWRKLQPAEMNKIRAESLRLARQAGKMSLGEYKEELAKLVGNRDLEFAGPVNNWQLVPVGNWCNQHGGDTCTGGEKKKALGKERKPGERPPPTRPSGLKGGKTTGLRAKVAKARAAAGGKGGFGKGISEATVRKLAKERGVSPAKLKAVWEQSDRDLEEGFLRRREKEGRSKRGGSYKHSRGIKRPNVSIYAATSHNAANGWQGIGNAFCPTGEGGGQDNSCSSGKSGSSTGKDKKVSVREEDHPLKAGKKIYRLYDAEGASLYHGFETREGAEEEASKLSRFEESGLQKVDQGTAAIKRSIAGFRHISTRSQAEARAENDWFNIGGVEKAFKNRKEFAKAVGDEWEKRQKKTTNAFQLVANACHCGGTCGRYRTLNAGGLPSEDIDGAKSCEILRDGEVHGKPLTEAQKGMFGAACGKHKKGKTENARMVVNASNSWQPVANCPGPMEFMPLESVAAIKDEDGNPSYDSLLAAVRRAFHAANPPQYDPADGRMLPMPTLVEVFPDYLIHTGADGKLYRHGYSVSDDGIVELDGDMEPVEKRVTFESVSNTENNHGWALIA